jgi:hypothetical protein
MSIFAVIFLVVAVILVIMFLFITFSCMMISGEISHEEEHHQLFK